MLLSLWSNAIIAATVLVDQLIYLRRNTDNFKNVAGLAIVRAHPI